MSNPPPDAERRSDFLRRCALSVLAIGVGSIAVWLTTEYARIFVDHGVDPRRLEPRALALFFLPGIAGAGLWLAAALLVTWRRFALGVYWSAVFVAVTFDLLTRFGGLDLSTPPGGESQVVYTPPDFYEGLMTRTFEVSLFGLLIVAGYWLSAPRGDKIDGVVVKTGG